jgi:hypothetical protein
LEEVARLNLLNLISNGLNVLLSMALFYFLAMVKPRFLCRRCNKDFSFKRNLLAHQQRRICRETRNPKLREKGLKTAKANARAKDAARKRAKYVHLLPRCGICAGPTRKWVGSKNCGHALHVRCYYVILAKCQERHPDYGRREGPPPCPYCRALSRL